MAHAIIPQRPFPICGHCGQPQEQHDWSSGACLDRWPSTHYQETQVVQNPYDHESSSNGCFDDCSACIWERNQAYIESVHMKIYRPIGISQNVFYLLCEAYRRLRMQRYSDDRGKPLKDRWLGLGTKTDYKPILKAGLMEWCHGEPYKRSAGWLRLTEKGEAVFRQNIRPLALWYIHLKPTYKNSYLSQYQLMR